MMGSVKCRSSDGAVLLGVAMAHLRVMMLSGRNSLSCDGVRLESVDLEVWYAKSVVNWFDSWGCSSCRLRL